MKDITISSRRIKKELTLLLACFVIASLINIAAIIIYNTPWLEVFTQIGYVLLLTILLYLILFSFRLIMRSLKEIFWPDADLRTL